MDSAYHYPPELFELLVDCISRLNRGKDALLIFFRGAGVPDDLYADLREQVQRDRDGITKFEITRKILCRLNDAGDSRLRERREVLRRVTEWEDFSTCWEGDRLPAQGLVANIREVVNVKDSFTRIRRDRDEERRARIEKADEEARRLGELRSVREQIKTDLYALFSHDNPQKRGILFEEVLNRLFSHYGLLVKDSFRRSGQLGEGVVEQIDGVIRLDGHIYLVEMKWLKQPVERSDASEHLSRIYSREAGRGLFITATEFSAGAKNLIRQALSRAVVVVCTLQELVHLLEGEGDLRQFLLEKVDRAIVELDPF